MDLKGKHLSASMIKTYLQCPLKFKLRYADHIRPSSASTPLALGSAFHTAMEVANQEVKKGKVKKKFTDAQLEKFLQAYRKTAVELGLSDQTAFNDGLSLVLSSLEQMDVKKHVLGTELEFNIVTPEGVPITGFIDEVVQLSDTEILINDYKTSRIAMSTEEAKEDIQLAMYDYAASVLFPEFSVIWVQLDFVRHEKGPVRVKRTLTQRRNFLKLLKAVHDSILEFDPEEDIQGRTNEYCAWCDYNQGCEEYVNLIQSYHPDLQPVESMSNAELISELERNNHTIKAVDSRNGQIKLQILELMENKNQNVRNDEREAYIVQNTSRVQDVSAVMTSIPAEDLLEYGIIKSVNNKGLDEYFRNNPDKKLQVHLDSLATVKFNNPSVRTKNAK